MKITVHDTLAPGEYEVTPKQSAELEHVVLCCLTTIGSLARTTASPADKADLRKVESLLSAALDRRKKEKA